MKDEFLNFTGPSWGEYSNASGRRRFSLDVEGLSDEFYDNLMDEGYNDCLPEDWVSLLGNWTDENEVIFEEMGADINEAFSEMVTYLSQTYPTCNVQVNTEVGFDNLVAQVVELLGCEFFTGNEAPDTSMPSSNNPYPTLYVVVSNLVNSSSQYGVSPATINETLLQSITLQASQGCIAQVDGEGDPDFYVGNQDYPDCYDHLDAYEYLQLNSIGNTLDSVIAYYNAIWTLLGGSLPFSPVVWSVPEGSSSDDIDQIEYEYLLSQQQHEQDSCQSSFMNGNCSSTSYGLNLYDREQVANTLASAITSYSNFMFGLIDGTTTFSDYTPQNVDPLEPLEGVYDIFNRVYRFETECGPFRVPNVVEQAVGEMAVQLITIMWEYGIGDLADYEDAGYSLQQLICQGEFVGDSLYSLWEVLNYTPTMCGGSGGDCPDCPECPDCGLSENCPDCDCPDPCPQGGGVTGGGGGVVAQVPTQFQNVEVKPTKPQKPTKPIPKSRVPRVRESRFNGRRR
jgi:hypothetical protein